jgi:hypothetical protein
MRSDGLSAYVGNVRVDGDAQRVRSAWRPSARISRRQAHVAIVVLDGDGDCSSRHSGQNAPRARRRRE